ncbi:HutD family protein [Fenollaria sporofastidiosus]|uniref:HutD family protein n=1 Tax=Fenollaria sporofastidiosus TaxID=2811778 RepID=UPI001BFFE0E4|nr:HutD family protein [Fenollaria sporofastidiosus]
MKDLNSKRIVSTWKGGTTEELCIEPKDASLQERNFDLRISSATIDLERSEFSDFTGYRRYLMKLEGDITLLIDDKEVIIKEDEAFEFMGDEKVISISKEPSRDFNVIIKEDRKADISIIKNKTKGTDEGAYIFALEDAKLNGKNVEKYSLYESEGEEMSLEGRFIYIKIFTMED